MILRTDCRIQYYNYCYNNFNILAPVVANTISTKTMYKGMGLYTITIPTSTFTDDDSITMSVVNNLSGTTPTTFSFSGTTLSVKMPNTYTGSFTTTVTDTDYVGQTVSTTVLFID